MSWLHTYRKNFEISYWPAAWIRLSKNGRIMRSTKKNRMFLFTNAKFGGKKPEVGSTQWKTGHFIEHLREKRFRRIESRKGRRWHEVKVFVGRSDLNQRKLSLLSDLRQGWKDQIVFGSNVRSPFRQYSTYQNRP